jgi:transcriptional regulator with XRE-family HTH domain
MTGEELRRIRENLGLSTEKFGRALGYQGTYGIAARHIRRFESGARPIPLSIGRSVPPTLPQARQYACTSSLQLRALL